MASPRAHDWSARNPLPGGLCAKAAVHLGELKADIAAAGHDQMRIYRELRRWPQSFSHVALTLCALDHDATGRLGNAIRGRPVLAYLLFATILLHVGAALYHALIRRDGVFRAMAGIGPQNQ